MGEREEETKGGGEKGRKGGRKDLMDIVLKENAKWKYGVGATAESLSGQCLVELQDQDYH
jgi:hypothetical protein